MVSATLRPIIVSGTTNTVNFDILKSDVNLKTRLTSNPAIFRNRGHLCPSSSHVQTAPSSPTSTGAFETFLFDKTGTGSDTPTSIHYIFYAIGF